jgi:2-dehydro-3-deoxyphosphooctonate aldolase (KDO 8-P synthase)
VAAGADAVFMEVHEEPSRAKSDASTALRLDELEALMRKLKRIDTAANQGNAAGPSAHGAQG